MRRSAAALAIGGEDVGDPRCGGSGARWRWRSRSATLSGELDARGADRRRLSDFADRAIDEALAAAMAERVPGAGTDGFAVLALGKLGSRELNYSSDVDLILLFDPATLPRRERDDAGEAAVRIARRLVELLQQRTEDGYVARVDLRLRPSPEVTPIVLPVDAAISYYEIAGAAVGAGGVHPRPGGGRRPRAGRALPRRDPAVHLAPGARFRGDRRNPRHQRPHPRPLCAGPALGPGYDLKRGRGGIREVEFFTQVQQLIHGGREPALRAPAVLDALPALAAAGRLEPARSRRRWPTPIAGCGRSSIASR